MILFAVALGDAAVVAIDLAGDAAAGSFHSSMETLAGKNDLEVTAGGGVPEADLTRLVLLPYSLHVKSRIEDYATVVASGETVPLIGVDLVAEASDPENAYAGSAARVDEFRHINDPDAVWVTRGLANQVGSRITLVVNDRAREYVVRGFIPDGTQVSGDAVLMDMGAAQAATGKLGRVDRILIRTPDSKALEVWQQRVREALPAGVLVNAQGSESYANRRMLAAFRWNLRILSYIAVIVGAFLIYNALSVSVVRRRVDIGTMRAVGASRNMVLSAFLIEAGMIGALGALASLPIGRLLAAGAVRMLSTTVNALYVSSRPGEMSISLSTIAFALVVGVGVSVISALAPAREASKVPPTEAMARGRREYEVHVKRGRDAIVALMLAAVGAGAAELPEIGGRPIMGYASALLFVGSAALLTPLLVQRILSGVSNALRRTFGVEALLAARSLKGSLRRTSVLVAALATAVAMITSVGIMVGSFRQTVLQWMENELPADLYIRSAGGAGADQHPTIAPGVAQHILSVPGVEAVSRFRAYEIEYQGLPATIAGTDVDSRRSQQGLSFLSHRDGGEVLRELASGNNAIVSEPFANKHHVKRGDSITLPLRGQSAKFTIIDVFYDYGHEAGFILLARDTLLRYLPDPAPSNLAVYITPGANLNETRAAVQRATAGNSLLIFSNREIRREGIRVFDQTFAVTYALEAISILVAVGGIAGALISIVMDRQREFGVLKSLGASGGQIRRLILIEAGLIGVFANVVGVPLGFVLSLVLVYVINKQSFGWTIQFHWPVAVLVGAMSVVYVSTVLAGLYPARIAVRLNPIEVLHEE